MSIPPVNSTSLGLGALNPNSLSADALMTYCQTQLGNIDSEVKTYFDQQQKMLAQKQVLSDLKNALSKYAPPKTEAQWDEVTSAYQKANNALHEIDPSGQITQQVQDLYFSLQPKIDAAATVKKDELKGPLNPWGIDYSSIAWATVASKEWWTGHVGDVGSVVDAVSGNAELNMIQLQSMMSKRQTAVQLTTNMLAKYDQTIASIINNVK